MPASPPPPPSPSPSPREAAAQASPSVQPAAGGQRDDLLPDALLADALSEVQRALAGLRHGTVTLVVQDGHVVQVETTSKVRFAGGRRSKSRWSS